MIARYVPAAGWLRRYSRADLVGDLIAGVIVAIMLVPQSMAYAQLAGLPPQVGLYASIVPLLAYAALGSSRTLAVGPVAIVSLMTAAAIAPLAEPGSARHVELALVLALMSGLFLLVLGVLRLGWVVNFLSHPVVAGFTGAAGIIIGVSQVKHLLGLDVPGSENLAEAIGHIVGALGRIEPATAAIGLGAIVILVAARAPFARLLDRWGVRGALAGALTKLGPLVAVILGILAVWAFDLADGSAVKIVGEIPAGLPPLTVPEFDRAVWLQLGPAAALIGLVGFLESVSIGKALAARRRESIRADNELMGLGAAGVAAGFTGGFPVTGGLSRSVVNFTAGARTQMASVFTAALIALTVVAFAAGFRLLPQAVLAAVVLVAVVPLIDIRAFVSTWRYDKADFGAMALTFAGVLALGIEPGIVAGIALSLLLHLWRTSRPHIAVVGRVGTTEHFRNVLRHRVTTVPGVHAMRVDESLYFANTKALEDHVLEAVAADRTIRHIVLIASAVNSIDSSALDTLEGLVAHLRDSGVTLHLAEVKGPVMDRLQRTDFLDRLAPGRVFLSTHEAISALEPRPAGA